MDPFIEQIAARLREPAPIDPAARDRVMRAVSEETPPMDRRARGRAEWLTRPRLVRVRPLGALAAAALVVIAVVRFVPRLAVDASENTNAAAPVTTAADNPGNKLVHFVLVARSASSVALVGDFNAWDRSTTPLLASGSGVWSIAVPLQPGRHEYAFVVDGRQWVADPEAARAPGDDFGASSSVVLVGEGTQ